MHERTKRLLCQLTFVFVCALPTIGTISVISIRTTSWHDNREREKLEAKLADRFGLQFSIGSRSVLAPGAIQLEDVTVIDPESKSVVATVRLIQWSTINGRIAVRLAQPELNSTHLPKAWALLHDRFLCRPDLTTAPLRLEAPDLTIRNQSESTGITLTEFRAQMQPHDFANETLATFKIAGRTMPKPAFVSIVRSRPTNRTPETAWKLHTNGAALPCSLLADYMPWLDDLGQAAEFNGPVEWRLRDSQWEVDLSYSTFSNIEASRVFSHLDHKLTGTANISFYKCKIEDGTMTDLHGKLSIHDGRVGQSLLNASGSIFDVNHWAQSDSPSIPFELICFNFALDESGWHLIGSCSDHFQQLRNGTLAVDSRNMPFAFVASSQSGRTIPPTALKNLLSPHRSAPLIPGAESGLLDLFPSPIQNAQVSDQYGVPRISMRETRE